MIDLYKLYLYVGGPLIIKHRDLWNVVGVTSWGKF